ncbi:RecJ-like exonuclease, contains DnaJ-type Zn finger domain [Haloarcula vallismortis]|uniref:RecJ-like exonuclease, contains DnaJ-type Zn finger domain n=2 Tax=Haloarcula vallismortis TaxID=28442 RepID=A0A1H2Y1J3_HALVA|nr:OB-fold nucleic acid binding domain-containing protein [Haloarcula vallismortis]EMA02034.1 putative nuclease/nucleic acid binding OB-fold tRNA/helicase-type [Haloarcula vallismortis ATCC 29715]SDW99073.1 RecJ-like exonuclease, contains DnaJ-type Zn finger domain [Haloarcula vallismortis]
MGSCIICGKSVEGRICDLHEEDALFEFRGSRADQLSVDRYYRGSVDGFAEFGVFVDIGDSVTGLLHRSELDQRLDSLDWEPGDAVYVQVKNVRDNGNVDLGWSIRQSEREFRGVLVDDPEIGHSVLLENEDNEDDEEDDEVEPESTADESTSQSDDESSTDDDSTASQSESESTASAGAVSRASDADRVEGTAAVGGNDSGSSAAAVTDSDDTEEADESQAETVAAAIGDLDDHVGADVRLEGEVVGIRQTSGPTVFELQDETGTVDCAAFVEAGVRAYPEVEEDDYVRLEGEVRERRGELQVETEALDVLEAEEREAVEQRLADALDDEARPDTVEPLADDTAVAALSEDLVEAATQIRKAVLTDRPVIVRHANTADGYLAGSALERAALPLVTEQHRRADAKYHYFDRRPIEGGVYDMDDATKDTTTMLDNRERHEEKLPLFVFVAAGGTRESLDGFDLLNVYGAPSVVIDDIDVDGAVVDTVDAVVSPSADSVSETTSTALAANVAAHVNEDVRDDLQHLPAVSFWEDIPEPYVDAASEAGYDETAVSELREAVALEAHYQSYEDKRELITDLVFGDDEEDVGGLAGHIAEQFREKVDEEVSTARANLDHRTVDDVDIAVLDTDAFTHQYEFPPESLLLDELHRDVRDESDAVLGISTDTMYVRANGDLDLHELVSEVSERVPEGGVATRSVREGTIRYLAGERPAVLEATLDVLADEL